MRSITIRAFSVLAIMWALPVSADEPKEVILEPLAEYAAKHSPAGPELMAYVFARCAGLYMAYAKTLERETSPGGVALREKSLRLSEDFFGTAARGEMSITGTKKKKVGKAERDLVAKLSDGYIDAAGNARVHSDDFSKDQLISADLAVCSSLTNDASTQK